MSKISYVIPIYHNQGSIHTTCEGIAYLFAGPLAEYEYEIVLVDDGSKDDSFTEMCAAAAQNPHVRTLRFSRNFGQIAAIIAGYNHATGDAVINMSADLQDPVELTVDMIKSWSTGSQVVVGYRQRREDPLAARFFSRLAYGALRMSNPEIPKGGFDFVLMSRRALNLFLRYKGRHRSFQGDVVWAGLATTFIPYTRRKRAVGKSQYNFSKKLKLFFDSLLDGSYLPIRLMSLCGVMVALLGAIYAGVVVAAWATGHAPFTGWAPIMIAILVVGGIIMVMLGIIGEYLWRILDEIKEKPLYIIDDGEKKDVQ